MKRGFLIAFLFGGFLSNAQSFTRLDSILNTLNNKDLFVAPVIRGVSITSRTDNTKQYPPRPMFVVSSLDADIKELGMEFSEEVVASKLYSLLSDPEKDIYADALLFQLFDDKKLGKLMFVTRPEWIKTGKQNCDMDFWKCYLTEKGIIAKADPLQYY